MIPLIICLFLIFLFLSGDQEKILVGISVIFQNLDYTSFLSAE